MCCHTTESGKTRVSYIIATRNRADFLDRALQNVRAFIAPEDELIVIDGMSTDHTAEVIKKHGDIISVFESSPDCGEAHALNKGILKSRGEVIKFITDDDYFYPQAMNQAVSVMLSHANIDALQCGGVMYRIDPGTNAERFHTYFCKVGPAGQLPVAGVGLFLRRAAIPRVGLLDAQCRFPDTDYHSRLVSCGVNFKYLNVKLFRHTLRLHSGEYRFPGRNLAESVRAHLLETMELPGGESLVFLMNFGLLLGRHTVGRWFIRLLAFIARPLQTLGLMFFKGRRRISGESNSLVEPVWDGSLS